MSVKDCRVPVLLVDEDGNPVYLDRELPRMPLNNRVVWRPGVVDPAQDYEGFKKQLEAWHRKNNPQLFEDGE